MEFKNNFRMTAPFYGCQYTITPVYLTILAPQNLLFVGIGRGQAASKSRYIASLLIIGKRGSQFMFFPPAPLLYL